MCKTPKVKQPTQEQPAILTTARDGLGIPSATSEGDTVGKKKLRLDLNSATASPYGSSLVIPT